MAINEVTSIDVKTLPPFKRLIMTLGELPTSYLESMTYAELLMWFCNFLQEKVLPTIDNNADALQDVITYLENLDLQDEVDHKLDEMAEAGTLQEIIADYLNSKAVFGFDTVADMKLATNLINGSYAKTLGYNYLKDGGNALYKIRTITNDDVVDERKIIALDDPSLIAELIVKNNPSVKQLGAWGDNEHDDTEVLNYAFNNFKNVYIPTGTYLTSDTLIIKEGRNIHGDGMYSTVINYSGNESAVQISNDYFGDIVLEKLLIRKGSAYTEGDTTSIGIEIKRTNRDITNLFCNQVAVRYFGTNLKSATAGQMLNSNFNECYFEHGYDNAYIVGGFNNYFNQCHFVEGKHRAFIQQSGEGNFKECLFENNYQGFEIRPSNGSYNFDNCFFEKIDTSYDNYLISVTSSNLNNVECINCINCHFYGARTQVFLAKVKKATFIGNTMLNAYTNCIAYGWSSQDIEDVTMIGNRFNVTPYTKLPYIHLIDEDVYDTGWVSIDTSSETLGTITNWKIRRIGKQVRMRGQVTGLLNTNIGSTFATKVPEGFRPAESTYCICSVYDPSSTHVDTCGNMRVYADGNFQYCGVKGTNATNTWLSLDTISYFID